MAEANASGNTPPANENPVTPPAGNGTPSQSGNEETVVLKKSEHDKLQKQAAQASEAQSRADSAQSKLDRYEKGGKRKVEVTTPFQAAELAEVKARVASTLLTNDRYRNLVGKDQTLAKVLTKNPLDVLDTDEFIDAEDAYNQVMDYLDEQVGKGSGTPPAQPPATPETPPVAAPTNPNPSGAEPTKTPEQKKQEDINKLPVMERVKHKIADKINVQ